MPKLTPQQKKLNKAIRYSIRWELRAFFLFMALMLGVVVFLFLSFPG